MRRSAVVLALAMAAVGLGERLADNRAKFEEKTVPLIRSYIFANYHKFAESELTFRHLKAHLTSKLPVSLEELKRDDLSEVIESTTDEIANECNAIAHRDLGCRANGGGPAPQQRRKHRDGQDPHTTSTTPRCR